MARGVAGWLALILLCLPMSAAGGESSAEGTVVGQVFDEGRENYRGLALLWRDCAAGNNLGKPDFAAALAEDGGFAVQAPPGEYCLGVLVRGTEGKLSGPPRRGDMIFLTPGAEGEVYRITLEAGSRLDVGNHGEGRLVSGEESGR
ncbi:MAG: hypothetical protein RBT64_02520 [Trichloromonas sp.]|jgi:hypothetical protein|nr:hypothetical protein [Trichloromonas sp.]